ncbi:nuclear transport factor 2 family protein [uncultured Algibacter sp.]|uniref:nuclear transport factor 2 family protein n=1 Tax=uncultured Algibacter sp. TaxID=298659 RepID=UPI002604C5A6|nr:nuclear transport factor 2 family protein [uncultured Algibacter sp.]
MKTLFKIIALILVVLSFNCKKIVEKPQKETAIEVSEEKIPEASFEQSKAVMDHHLKAFLENDIEAFIADYTEESIIVTQDSIYKGLEQIKALAAGLFPAFPTGETNIVVDKLFIKNELVYLVWHGDSPALNVPLGTDTFIIKNNKIMQQTFAGILNPKDQE